MTTGKQEKKSSQTHYSNKTQADAIKNKQKEDQKRIDDFKKTASRLELEKRHVKPSYEKEKATPQSNKNISDSKDKYILNIETLDSLIDKLSDIEINTLYYMIESYNDNPTVANINLYYDKIMELKTKYQISDILSKIALANSAPQLTSHNERELEKIKNNNLKIENDAKTKAETIKTSNNKIASTLDDLNSSIDKETMANRK